MTEFEKFALDHLAHKHCIGCGGCVLENSKQVLESYPIWCVACRDAIKRNNPPILPWAFGWERP